MIGQALAHYKILEKIGSGGMGDVYLAEDAKLDRKVALKVLPPELAENEERRARFEREAKAVAALNHPNIVTVHSVEEADGVHFITMELVEGKTLAKVIPSKGFPLERFFDIAIPLADAVAAAHKKGTIHRDLKPSNVMVTEDGSVKMLDFGVARIEAPVPTEDDSESPTMPKTAEGVLVGTLLYMSPEQVRGKAVDTRSDIYSLGLVFYQMLSGHNPVAGDSAAERVVAILQEMPPLLANVPKEVAQLVNWCLTKDPESRLQDAADLRNYLTSLRQELTAAPRPTNQIWKYLGAVAALALVIAGGAVLFRMLDTVNRSDAPRLTNPVQVTFADGLEDYPAWSPDGRTIAYHANNDGNMDIWIQQFGGSDALNRTRDYAGVDQFPSWSPDGSQLAFWSEREGGGYFVMPTLAGAPRKISSGASLGAPCWSPDGRLAHITIDGSQGWFSIVSLDTGETERFPVPADIPPGLSPACHPGGDLVAFVSTNQWESTSHELRVMRLSDGLHFTAMEDSWESWSPAWWKDDTLAFVSNRGGVLDMWMLDVLENGEPHGEPIALSMGLELRSLAFSVDRKKVAYSRGRRVANVWRIPRGLTRPATWNDVEQVTFDQTLIEFIDIKPDGSQLLFDSDRSGNPDLWIKYLATGKLSQITAHPSPDWGGRFSPDGDEIVFYSLRSGSRDVWVTATSGGSPRRLTDFPGHDLVPSWSPDGDEIAYVSLRTSYDLYKVPSSGGEPVLIHETGERTASVDWSFDGRSLIFNQDSRLWRAPIDGGSPEALTATGVSGAMLRRAPDRDEVYMVGRGDDDNNLFRVRVGDRAKHVVTDLTGRRGSMGWNGIAVDHEFVYFTWQDDLGDIWVVDVVTDSSE